LAVGLSRCGGCCGFAARGRGVVLVLSCRVARGVVGVLAWRARTAVVLCSGAGVMSRECCRDVGVACAWCEQSVVVAWLATPADGDAVVDAPLVPVRVRGVVDACWLLGLLALLAGWWHRLWWGGDWLCSTVRAGRAGLSSRRRPGSCRRRCDPSSCVTDHRRGHEVGPPQARLCPTVRTGRARWSYRRRCGSVRRRDDPPLSVLPAGRGHEVGPPQGCRTAGVAGHAAGVTTPHASQQTTVEDTK